jgi:hypothetical protein
MWPTLINTLSPWQWAVLALIPPAIIALYFLKLRRDPVDVPSTYLWRRSFEELNANSLWQKLRRNLLLWLQLLAVLLAALALLRPGWKGSQLAGNRFIILIDHSASMSATDMEPSRLEVAKSRARDVIEQMPAGSSAMLISFSDQARVVQEFTDNRRLLRQRLASIKPTERSTSLAEALKLAAGLAHPGRSESDDPEASVTTAMPVTLYIFSDGRLSHVDDFSLGNLEPIYVPLGRPDTGNLAITALSVRRSASGPARLLVFVRAANISPSPAKARLELSRDGSLLDAAELQFAPDAAESVVFELADDEPRALTLTLAATDALAGDNVAHVAVNASRHGKVLLVTPGNPPLAWALETSQASGLVDMETVNPTRLATEAYRHSADAGDYDLIVFDRCRPESMPQANTLWIGQIPPHSRWENGESAKRVSAPQILDTEHTHPLMQSVQLDNVLIGESLIVKPPAGGRVLVDSTAGALMAIAPRGPFLDLVLGFEIVHSSPEGDSFNTNWPLGKLSYPTFFLNVLSRMGGSVHGDTSSPLRPGQPAVLRGADEGSRVKVTRPAGQNELLQAGRGGTVTFHATDASGIYEVTHEDRRVERFAVSLLDPRESDLRTDPQGSVRIGYVDIAGQANWEPARREAWRGLLLLALAVLMVEWYIYNRRVWI